MRKILMALAVCASLASAAWWYSQSRPARRIMGNWDNPGNTVTFSFSTNGEFSLYLWGEDYTNGVHRTHGKYEVWNDRTVVVRADGKEAELFSLSFPANGFLTLQPQVNTNRVWALKKTSYDLAKRADGIDGVWCGSKPGSSIYCIVGGPGGVFITGTNFDSVIASMDGQTNRENFEGTYRWVGPNVIEMYPRGWTNAAFQKRISFPEIGRFRLHSDGFSTDFQRDFSKQWR